MSPRRVVDALAEFHMLEDQRVDVDAVEPERRIDMVLRALIGKRY